MDVFRRSAPTGATAGHLGTAWASYLLSPSLNDSLFSLPTPPASYADRSVLKAAVLMTDGEYNTLTSNGGSSVNNSPKQALEQCRAMRSRGIKVYTVGFGFPVGSKPPKPDIEKMSEAERVTPLATGSSTEKVLDMLAKCASDSKSYFFPYDGNALRAAFKNIATDVKCFVEVCNARLMN
jgi:hypothetical protein